MRKFRTVFWGIFFLVAAVFILVSQLGYLTPRISLWRLILSVFLLAITVEGVLHMEFFSILVPLAGIACLFDAQLGLQAITPWPLLGAATFASIGLSIIFHNKGSRWKQKYAFIHSDNAAHPDFEETVENLNANMVFSKVTFGASIKYLHAQRLERAEFECSFGSLKVYFDQAQLSPDGADVRINCSFGGVTLYVPRGWTVKDDINASIGTVKNRENRPDTENVLRVRGNVSFGGVDIVYI